MLLGSASQLWVAKAEDFLIVVAGLLGHWAAGTQEVIVCLAALPPAWGAAPNKWFPLDAESPGRQNGGDCFLAGSFAVYT